MQVRQTAIDRCYGWLGVAVSERVLALFRVLFGLVALGTVVAWLPRLYDIFASGGYVAASVPHAQMPYAVSPFFYNDERWFVTLLAGLLLLNILIVIVSRRRAWLAASIQTLLFISFYQRFPYLSHGPDQVLSAVSLVLPFLLYPKEGVGITWFDSGMKLLQPLAWRLAQWQIATVYLVAGWQKLLSSQWTDGSFIYRVLYWKPYAIIHLPELGALAVVIQLLDFIILAIELSAPALLFTRRTSLIMSLVLMAMHIGLAIFINVGWFSYIMVACLVLFWNEKDMQLFARFISPKMKRMVRTIFDTL